MVKILKSSTLPPDYDKIFDNPVNDLMLVNESDVEVEFNEDITADNDIS